MIAVARACLQQRLGMGSGVGSVHLSVRAGARAKRATVMQSKVNNWCKAKALCCSFFPPFFWGATYLEFGGRRLLPGATKCDL